MRGCHCCENNYFDRQEGCIRRPLRCCFLCGHPMSEHRKNDDIYW